MPVVTIYKCDISGVSSNAPAMFVKLQFITKPASGNGGTRMQDCILHVDVCKRLGIPTDWSAPPLPEPQALEDRLAELLGILLQEPINQAVEDSLNNR